VIAMPIRLVAAGLIMGLAAVTAQQPPQASTVQQPLQQPSEVELRITGDPGTPPRYAVPDFVALNPGAAEAAKTLGQVLWDDLHFEREFYMIPRDTYATIPAARNRDEIPFAAWRELGADAVVFGTAERRGDDLRVQVWLYNVRTRQSVYSKEFTGPARNPRLFAHTVADEIHLQQRALRGVARTKIAFVSDRNRERVLGTVENREVKEIYIADYDGANVQRVTVTRHLNGYPSWAPDGRALAYTSWRRIQPDIFVSLIYQGILQNPTKGQGSNYDPAFSPDGTRIAFWSNRHGNPEIYVMNADGSNVRRLTNHSAGDSSPTWSPTGAQIAFTSDRSGSPQVYVMNAADGSNVRRISVGESYADSPSWSPTTNEIAFAARTGAGYDIKVYDLNTGQTRQLTFGEGSNESPSFSPNGRHLAFTSTRRGAAQIFTMTRDGRDVRQITREGTNISPAWSN